MVGSLTCVFDTRDCRVIDLSKYAISGRVYCTLAEYARTGTIVGVGTLENVSACLVQFDGNWFSRPVWIREIDLV